MNEKESQKDAKGPGRSDQKVPGNRQHFEEVMNDNELQMAFQGDGPRDQDDSDSQRGMNVHSPDDLNLNADSDVISDQPTAGTRNQDIREGKKTNRGPRQGFNEDARDQEAENDPDRAL